MTSPSSPSHTPSSSPLSLKLLPACNLADHVHVPDPTVSSLDAHVDRCRPNHRQRPSLTSVQLDVASHRSSPESVCNSLINAPIDAHVVLQAATPTKSWRDITPSNGRLLNSRRSSSLSDSCQLPSQGTPSHRTNHAPMRRQLGMCPDCGGIDTCRIQRRPSSRRTSRIIRQARCSSRAVTYPPCSASRAPARFTSPTSPRQ